MKKKKQYIKPQILVEEWKVYKTTCRDKRVYEVSNLGRIKINGVITEPHITHHGYNKISGFWVHRAVAELFIPNPENKPFVDHIDTNRLNNREDNLRWVTSKENANNPLTRKHRSDMYNDIEFRKHNSEAQKKAQNRPDVKEKRILTYKNPEVLQKMSEAQRNRVCINKNNVNKKVKKDQLELFLNDGWVLGRKNIKPKP